MRGILVLPMFSVFCGWAASVEPPAAEASLRCNLRTRVQPFKGSADWEEVAIRRQLEGKETAIIICDMWDDHWCKAAAKRCDALARRVDPVLDAARRRGITVIHAPSDCMDFYKEFPQRKRMLALDRVEPPKNLEIPDPPLPVETPTGGCDDPEPVKPFKAWKRQHPAITIAEQDLISDRGEEIHAYLHKHGIKNVLILGVHTNMCILHRSFGIKQLTRWGYRCILVRDLTDAMYSPKDKPFVTHEEGTERVIQYIEKYWCPTMLSEELVKKAN